MAQQVERTLIKLLDFCTQKQKVLSKNIANVGTEDYKREDVRFKEILNESISTIRATNSKHISFDATGTPADQTYEIVTDPDMEKHSGINNVDIDTEMAEMAENALKFKFASRKIGDYYRNLQNVIKSGSGR